MAYAPSNPSAMIAGSAHGTIKSVDGGPIGLNSLTSMPGPGQMRSPSIRATITGLCRGSGYRLGTLQVHGRRCDVDEPAAIDG